MKKLTKIAAITLLAISAGSSLAACSNLSEPKYNKDLTPAKVFKAVSGDKDNQTKDLTGEVIKGTVDHIGKGSSGIKGYILKGTPKDKDGSAQMSFIPDNQGNLKYKKGDTAYLKIKTQSAIFGLVVITCKEVTK